MTPTTLAMLWAAFVADWAMKKQGPGRIGRAGSVFRVARIGRAVRQSRPLHRFVALDESDDVLIGGTLLSGAAVAVMAPALGALLVLGGWLATLGRARRRTAEPRVDPLQLSAVIDLTIVATSAGLDSRSAIRALEGRVDEPFADSTTHARTILDAGGDQRMAWRSAFAPSGDLGTRAAASIDDAERDGVSLTSTLTRVSADLELLGRRQAEQRARRLPVKLLFPLIGCVLPAFVLLTVVPLLAGSIGSLPF